MLEKLETDVAASFKLSSENERAKTDTHLGYLTYTEIWIKKSLYNLEEGRL